jgi:S1-C subfamily serine protease
MLIAFAVMVGYAAEPWIPEGLSLDTTLRKASGLLDIWKDGIHVRANTVFAKYGRDQFFVTTYHAPDGMDSAYVTIHGLRLRVKRITVVHPMSDLCILDVEIKGNIVPLEINPDIPLLGETLALVYKGEIVRIDTIIGFDTTGYHFRNWTVYGIAVIRMKGRLNPGWSGCPLVNRQGRIVAIASFGIRSVDSSESVEDEYWAILAERIKEMMDTPWIPRPEKK